MGKPARGVELISELLPKLLELLHRIRERLLGLGLSLGGTLLGSARHKDAIPLEPLDHPVVRAVARNASLDARQAEIKVVVIALVAVIVAIGNRPLAAVAADTEISEAEARVGGYPSGLGKRWSAEIEDVLRRFLGGVGTEDREAVEVCVEIGKEVKRLLLGHLGSGSQRLGHMVRFRLHGRPGADRYTPCVGVLTFGLSAGFDLLVGLLIRLLIRLLTRLLIRVTARGSLDQRLGFGLLFRLDSGRLGLLRLGSQLDVSDSDL